MSGPSDFSLSHIKRLHFYYLFSTEEKKHTIRQLTSEQNLKKKNSSSSLKLKKK